MFNRIRSEQGASMLYVMAALIVTSFLSIALLKMSGSGNMAQSFYHSSASARSAAKSGLIAAVNFLESENTTYQTAILDMLNDWFTLSDGVSPTNKVLPLSIASLPQDSDGFIPLSGDLTDIQKYKVSIQAVEVIRNGVEDVDVNISLLSRGKGKGNSQASTIAVYKISGLKIDVDMGYKPTNALQMDNGGWEINTNMIIKGNMAMRGGITLNAPFVSVEGDFRADLTSAGVAKDIELHSGEINFHGKTYFSGDAPYMDNTVNIDLVKNDPSDTLRGEIVFHDNAGFDGHFNMNPSKIVFPSTDQKKYVFTGGFQSNGGTHIDANGHEIVLEDNSAKYMISTIDEGLGYFENKAPGSSKRATAPTPLEVGFTREEPDPEIYFNTSLLNNIIDYDGNNFPSGSSKLTSDDLNTLWETKSTQANGLWNGFLVLRFLPDGANGGWYQTNSIFGKGTEPFKYKAIILNEAGRMGNFFDTDLDNGLVVLHLEKGSGSGSWMVGMEKFRGYIHVEKKSGGSFTFGFQQEVDSHLKGAVYGNGKVTFNFNTTKKAIGDNADPNSGIAGLEIPGIQAEEPFTTNLFEYDPGVIDELYMLGLFKDPTTTSSELLKYETTRLSTSLLSQSI